MRNLANFLQEWLLECELAKWKAEYLLNTTSPLKQMLREREQQAKVSRGGNDEQT